MIRSTSSQRPLAAYLYSCFANMHARWPKCVADGNKSLSPRLLPSPVLCSVRRGSHLHHTGTELAIFPASDQSSLPGLGSRPQRRICRRFTLHSADG